MRMATCWATCASTVSVPISDWATDVWCPKGRVGFRVELGCQFMGHMKVYQDEQELNIDDLRDKATDDLSKLIDKWTVYPVFKLAVTGRFL